ncbi:MAG: UDP-2,3-diacylglucosamine diphosphatase LpxI [Pseudomonadota bacterium]
MGTEADGPLAIVAGAGVLPRLLAEGERGEDRPHLVIAFDGIAPDWIEAHPHEVVPFEKPGRLLRALKGHGIRRVCFAGGMQRPQLKPLRFDATLLRWAPRLLPALRGGDDALLRLLAEFFEVNGYTVVAAHDLSVALMEPAGVPTRTQPTDADRKDAARARAILGALAPHDVGQAAVVAQGLCLGIETVQGTDALLRFVAQNPVRMPDPEGGRGVLVKTPKEGQDARLDMPAIGPDTIRHAADAGLSGLVIEAGAVMVLGREEVVALADAAGLFILSDAP